MKSKNFIKDFFAYSLNGLLTKMFAFIMIPIIARFFSVKEFGVLETMLSVLGFGALIIGMGYDISMKKSMLIDDEAKEKSDYILTNFLFLLFWGAFFVSIMFIFRDPITKLIFGSYEYVNVFIFAVIGCYLNALISLFLTLSRIEFRTKAFLLTNTIKVLLEYLFIVFVLFFIKKQVYYYFLSIVIIDFLYLVILLLINRKRFRGKIKKDIICNIYSFGFPAMISGIGYWIFNMSDRVIISNQTGSTYQTGIYSMIIKMLSIYTFLIMSFKQAWIPRAFQMYKEDKENFKEKLEKIQIYALIIFSIIAILNFAGLKLMINVFATKEYMEGIKIAYPLILAFIIFPLTDVASVGLYISNNTKKLSYVVWIAAILNILINFLLISKIGILAASISTLVAYIYIYIYYWKISCKFFSWKINWKKPILIIFLITITILGINFVNIKNIYIDLVIKLLISFCYIFMIFSFKFIDMKQIKTIIKEMFKKK